MEKFFKRILATIMVVLIVITSVPLSSFVGFDWSCLDFSIKASASTEGYYTYVVENGEASITDVDTSISGDVIIPSTLGDYPVTNIGDSAFNCDGLASITIPDSVTSLGERVFFKCANLTSITVDENNKYYSSDEYGVLYNKDKTTLIQYPRGNERTSYTIPDSVTSMSEWVFSNCSGLTSVIIGNGVTSISKYAFSYCSVESVTIGNSVTTIGKHAFLGCSLASITIPDSVTSIGEEAFLNCDRLTSVTVDENNKYYSSDEYGILYNKDKTTLIQYPEENDRTSYTIPESVTSIGEEAFFNCDSLTSVIIGNSVTSIGNQAFSNCNGLTSVIIGNGVTTIGEDAFFLCKSLASVTIPDSVTSIGYCVFFGCDKLADVYYTGTQEQWEKISIDSSNDPLTSATIHYNSTGDIDETDIPVVDFSIDSGFKLGVDNNSFYHFDEFDPSSGFYRVYDYSLSYKYFKKLTEDINPIERAKIALIINNTEWGGSCFGISASMGLLFEDYITIEDLTDRKANNYFEIGRPNNDKQFLDNIQYYQVASYIGKIDERKMATSVTYNENRLSNLSNKSFDYDTNATFLRKLIVEMLKGKIAMICYSGGDGGHAVLATGYEYIQETKEYRIKLYDMNTVGTRSSNNEIYTKGYFHEMIISSDYSEFKFVSNGKSYFSNKTLEKMVLYSFDKLQQIAYREDNSSSFSLRRSPENNTLNNDCAKIEFYTNKPIIITNKEGEKLSYDGEFFSGDLPIHTFNFVGEGEDTRYSIETDNTEYFEVESTDGSIMFEAYNSERYLMLKDCSATKVKLSFSEGVLLNGDEYSFEACLTTDENALESQKGIASISAKASGDVSISVTDNIVKTISENELENIITSTYTGLVEQETKIEQKTDKIEIAVEKETEHNLGEYVITREATCTRTGLKVRICSTCGAETDEKIIPCVDHIGGTAHCKEKAKCSVCGTSYGSLADHSYTAATCTAPKTCKVCKATTGKALGHKYSNSCDTTCNTCKATRKIAHSYKSMTTKATLSKNGKLESRCSVCGNVSKTTIYYPKTIKLSKTSFTYNGKVQKPSVTVKNSKGNTLKKDTDYTVTYESGCKASGKYTIKIVFKGKYEGTKKLTYTIVPKATSKITVSQTTTTITLKWNKVTGADGYRVYKYDTKTKKYKKLKDVTKTTLKISKLKAGTSYKYKVRAYTKDDGTIWGDYSKVFETATKCKTPKITKLTTTKGKASFTWSNVSGESGYQVYYSTKKDSGYKKVKSYKANATKGSKSKLKSGKKYYFKVRAYKKTASGTVYSTWSTVKNVKVK